MPEKLIPMHGTSSAADEYTGSKSEITMDETNNTIRVHDGVKKGGHPLASTNQHIGDFSGIDLQNADEGDVLTVDANKDVITKKIEVKQSDYNETDVDDPSFIKNKPDLAEYENVQSDWTEQDDTSETYIANKITPSTPSELNDKNTDSSFVTPKVLSEVTNISVGIGSNSTEGSVCLGVNAGGTSTGEDCVNIGKDTGKSSQGGGSVAVGLFAGSTGQSSGGIAVGNGAAQSSQGANGVAVGNGAGRFSQGGSAVSLGPYAGYQNQGIDSVAVGPDAGRSNQSTLSVSVGNEAGKTSQGGGSVAIGNESGKVSQESNSVAIGNSSGREDQEIGAVAIGYQSGDNAQGTKSLAIGYKAGLGTQGANSIALGTEAGRVSQGDRAIAIGENAGHTDQEVDGVHLKTGDFDFEYVPSTKTLDVTNTAGDLGFTVNGSALGGGSTDTQTPLFFNALRSYIDDPSKVIFEPDGTISLKSTSFAGNVFRANFLLPQKIYYEVTLLSSAPYPSSGGGVLFFVSPVNPASGEVDYSNGVTTSLTSGSTLACGGITSGTTPFDRLFSTTTVSLTFSEGQTVGISVDPTKASGSVEITLHNLTTDVKEVITQATSADAFKDSFLDFSFRAYGYTPSDTPTVHSINTGQNELVGSIPEGFIAPSRVSLVKNTTPVTLWTGTSNNIDPDEYDVSSLGTFSGVSGTRGFSVTLSTDDAVSVINTQGSFGFGGILSDKVAVIREDRSISFTTYSTNLTTKNTSINSEDISILRYQPL